MPKDQNKTQNKAKVYTGSSINRPERRPRNPLRGGLALLSGTILRNTARRKKKQDLDGNSHEKEPKSIVPPVAATAAAFVVAATAEFFVNEGGYHTDTIQKGYTIISDHSALFNAAIFTWTLGAIIDFSQKVIDYCSSRTKLQYAEEPLEEAVLEELIEEHEQKIDEARQELALAKSQEAKSEQEKYLQLGKIENKIAILRSAQENLRNIWHNASFSEKEEQALRLLKKHDKKRDASDLEQGAASPPQTKLQSLWDNYKTVLYNEKIARNSLFCAGAYMVMQIAASGLTIAAMCIPGVGILATMAKVMFDSSFALYYAGYPLATSLANRMNPSLVPAAKEDPRPWYRKAIAGVRNYLAETESDKPLTFNNYTKIITKIAILFVAISPLVVFFAPIPLTAVFAIGVVALVGTAVNSIISYREHKKKMQEQQLAKTDGSSPLEALAAEHSDDTKKALLAKDSSAIKYDSQDSDSKAHPSSTKSSTPDSGAAATLPTTASTTASSPAARTETLAAASIPSKETWKDTIKRWAKNFAAFCRFMRSESTELGNERGDTDASREPTAIAPEKSATSAIGAQGSTAHLLHELAHDKTRSNFQHGMFGHGTSHGQQKTPTSIDSDLVEKEKSPTSSALPGLEPENANAAG